MLDFNGELRSAGAVPGGLRFSYESSARALAVLNARPRRLEIDRAPCDAKVLDSGANFVLTLPRGQHVVQLTL